MTTNNTLYSAANINGFTYTKYTTSKNDDGEFSITFYDVKESEGGIKIGLTVCEDDKRLKSDKVEEHGYVDKYLFQLFDEIPFSIKHLVVTNEKRARTIKLYKIYHLIGTDRITPKKFGVAVTEYFELRPPITGVGISCFLRGNIKKELDVLREVLFSDKMTDGERYCIAFDYFFHE